jgi:hypothetical protein
VFAAQVADLDERGGAELHQVEQHGAAGKELGARLSARTDRVGNLGGSAVLEGGARRASNRNSPQQPLASPNWRRRFTSINYLDTHRRYIVQAA